MDEAGLGSGFVSSQNEAAQIPGVGLAGARRPEGLAAQRGLARSSRGWTRVPTQAEEAVGCDKSHTRTLASPSGKGAGDTATRFPQRAMGNCEMGWGGQAVKR